MDLNEKWEKALESTDIIKSSSTSLSTVDATKLPYTYLAESEINVGDTLVRKGKVVVHKPSIVLPSSFPQFDGFEFKKHFDVDDDMVRTFLMVRGVSFPSFRYANEVASLEVYEGSLSQAADHFADRLAWREDIETALITGADDCWQFSILIFAASMVSKSAPRDIQKFLDDLKDKGNGDELGFMSP